MPSPNELGHLKTQQWQQLEELAGRFEKAWQQVRGQAEAIDLHQFLPPPGDPLRTIALPELIKSDLEIRWRRGQVIDLELYLERFPELGPLRALSPQLIYEEYRVRQMYGDQLPLEKYQRRFPEQFARLQRLLEEQPLPTVAGAAAAAGATNATPVPPVAGFTGGDQVWQVGGGYKRIKRIGSGSFGEVWRAEAPGGVEVAVKIISRPLDHEEAQREMEALELIKRLRHPYLAATQAYWALEDRLYIVMELADGSLRDRLKQCREAGQPGIPLHELTRYFHESAEALDYLHAEHVHHRDIKPENILLLKGHAKVADFGLAKMLQSQRLVASATSSGTPAYMAPEVWRGKVSAHSDQYSLAVAYAELRLNHRLFAGTAMFEIMLSHAEKTPDLTPLELSEQQVLLKALSKEPAQRYETCMAFVRALEQAVAAELLRSNPQMIFDHSGRPISDMATDLGTLAPGSLPGQVRQRISATEVEGRAQPGWRTRPAARARLGAAVVLLAALTALGTMTAWQWLRPGTFRLETLPALTVHADETAPLTVRVQRDRLPGAIALTFAGVPDHLHIEDGSIPADADSVQVPVRVDADAEPGPVTITVHAEAKKGSHETTVGVLVEPLATLPPGYRMVAARSVGDPEPANIVTVHANGMEKKYYKWIAGERGGMPVVFRLIPFEKAADPETFYIMRDKVWNDLFRKFADEKPKALDPKMEWRKGGVANKEDVGIGNGQYPVLRVTVEEADRCARWLGGLLPTIQQWEKAAGCDAEGGRGPFLGGKVELDPNKQPPEVALNRGDLGPLEVGKATHDRSRFLCRDMAGNGQEWTRNTVDSQVVPVAQPSADLEVAVRGRDYGAQPLPLMSMALYRKRVSDWKEYRKAYPEVGFRVVLEPR